MKHDILHKVLMYRLPLPNVLRNCLYLFLHFQVLIFIALFFECSSNIPYSFLGAFYLIVRFCVLPIDNLRNSFDKMEDKNEPEQGRRVNNDL